MEEQAPFILTISGGVLSNRYCPVEGIFCSSVLNVHKLLEESGRKWSDVSIVYGDLFAVEFDVADRRDDGGRTGAENLFKLSFFMSLVDFIDADSSFNNLHPPGPGKFYNRVPCYSGRGCCRLTEEL